MEEKPTDFILDQGPSAVISLDEGGVVTYWSQGAEDVFGIRQPDALGRSVAELIVPPRFRAAHEAGLQRFSSAGLASLIDRRVELIAMRADGSEFPAEVTLSAGRSGPTVTFTAVVRDIADRKQRDRERERLLDDLRTTLRLSERRFDAVVGSLSDPVTIRDRSNTLVYANKAALDHLGFESLEELRKTPPDQIMSQYVVRREDGSEVTMDQIPSVRILEGEQPEPLMIGTLDRRTGAQRWILLKAAPLVDERGETEATIMVTEDVTEQQRAERQAQFLAHASEVLASSLDYEQTLRNVAQLAVPDIADWCAVDLVDEDGGRIPVAVAHSDPTRLELAEQLRQYEPGQLDPDRGIGLVFRTGEPLLYPEIPEHLLVESAVDERHLELLGEVGFHSALIVPMRLGSRTLGAMTLVNAESGRVLDQPDLELAEQIGLRAAVAVENSRLYSERSTIAHTLQQSLLPEQLPEIPGYELAGVYMPAQEGAEVGGDFYDVWQLDGAWMITVGDVTGKGVEAAALTSLVRHTMRSASEFVSSPSAVLAHVDRALKRQRSHSICTALCLRLEGNHLTLSVGGHPLPIAVTPGGVSRIGEYGALLGGFDGAHWHDTSVELEPGTTLVTYTDGVTDAIGEDGTRYGIQRLFATLSECRKRSASGVVEHLTAALGSFQIGPHADDTAVLALRRASPGATPGGQATNPAGAREALGVGH